MDKSKHTEYEIQQLNDYGYIKFPFKKQILIHIITNKNKIK